VLTRIVGTPQVVRPEPSDQISPARGRNQLHGA
jgi:hypothetical protein